MATVGKGGRVKNGGHIGCRTAKVAGHGYARAIGAGVIHVVHGARHCAVVGRYDSGDLYAARSEGCGDKGAGRGAEGAREGSRRGKVNGFGCIVDSGKLGGPDGVKLRAEWAEAGANVDGEGRDGVLPIGSVVDYATDGREGIVGTDFGEGSPVETAHRPAQREKAGGIYRLGGGVAPGIEDAWARSLKVEEEVGVVGGKER